MTLTYEQVSELLPAYSVGALENEEQAAVEEYFYRHQKLINRLATAESATVLLAKATESTPIAPDAKARLMTRIQADVPQASRKTIVPGSNEERATRAQTPQRSIQAAQSSPEANGNRSPRRSLTMASPAHNQPPAQRSTAVATSARHSEQTRSGQSVPASAPRPVAKRGPGRRLTAEELFPQVQKRRRPFLFNTRAVVNALTIASLVTLIFVGLVNYDVDQDLRRTATELQSTKSELDLSQSRLIELNSANAILVDQFSKFIDEQTRLREENQAIQVENEQILAQQSTLSTQIGDLTTDNRNLSIERARLYEENIRLTTQSAMREERIALVSAATRAVVMFGAEGFEELQGTFFQREQEGALVVHGLEPLSNDETYQFWLVTEDGSQISIGLFQVDENQEPTWANLSLPSDAPNYTAAGISIEPVEGSDVPTGPMLLESPLNEESGV
ncbi:MAG: anti-sigma factor [Chloroflexota bacterium]